MISAGTASCGAELLIERSAKGDVGSPAGQHSDGEAPYGYVWAAAIGRDDDSVFAEIGHGGDQCGGAESDDVGREPGFIILSRCDGAAT
mmetsp:Transcript_10882/g.21025  ORF Transcript_10882/g.21025 Transcript_10882/m.21025 type:complete len:89 (+) Transcript_10882:2859-3125(+)